MCSDLTLNDYEPTLAVSRPNLDPERYIRPLQADNRHGSISIMSDRELSWRHGSNRLKEDMAHSVRSGAMMHPLSKRLKQEITLKVRSGAVYRPLSKRQNLMDRVAM